LIEDFPNQPMEAASRRAADAPRPRRWPLLVLTMLVGFGAGAVAMGEIAHQGWLRPFGIAPWEFAPQPVALPTPPQPSSAALAQTQGAMEQRVAGLEQKLDKLDLEAAAASGNAARAEALLVAFATRRLVQKGAPLGYLEDQLKLRFGAAQPDAVATIITFAHDPVTLDRLTARLEALGPMLAKSPPTESGWARVKREFADLFVLRHESPSAAPDPRLRLDHARVALQEGKVEDAIADVRLMPGASMAQDWISQTQRYDTAQRALDAIETTALLEPKTLHDGAGREIAQPSPLETPGASVSGTPSPAPAPEPSGDIKGDI
jgi:hypothetical protein